MGGLTSLYIQSNFRGLTENRRHERLRQSNSNPKESAVETATSICVSCHTTQASGGTSEPACPPVGNMR